MNEEERPLTPEEAEEAIRRVVQHGKMPTDAEIAESLAEAVSLGDMEYVGDGKYRMTAQGEAKAEAIMRDSLQMMPPWHDAEVHLHPLLAETMTDDATQEDYAAAMQFAMWVIRNEHNRLADLFDKFTDEWASEVAEALRNGLL